MITIILKDNSNLKNYAIFLSELSPLMRQWRDARQKIFDDQFDAELNPENIALRSLTKQYQDWKDKNYPGRKKRELTGQTKSSHNFSLGRNTLNESVGVNAVYLQENLELPLIPDDWTDPTYQNLYSLSEQYLINNF